MGRIDAEGLIQDTDIVQVIGRHIALKREGAEHIGLCPFHGDDKPSLKVNNKKKLYHCFACGAGGDVIDFLMRMGRTFHEACQEINGGVPPEPVSPEQREAKPKAAPNSWRHVSPAPIEPVEFRHYRHGIASAVWMYTDQEGRTVGYVARFNLPDGSKEVLPYVYATDGTRSEWRWMGFSKPRPVYNLHLLQKYPDATVLVVEGEKTAEALQPQFNPEKTVVTTWLGGSHGIGHVDWMPLTGRKTILWPDHDTEQKYGKGHPKEGQVKPWHEQPGNEAMLNIADIIRNNVPVLKWVNVPEEYPHKWDGADKEWKPGECRQFVLDNLTDVPEVPHVMDEYFDVEEPPAPKNPPPPAPTNPPPPPRLDQLPDEDPQSRNDNGYFKCLGFDHDENRRLAYYFFSYEAKSVVKLSPSSMTKSNLMMLAPINWWEGNFPARNTRVDTDAAQQFLITMSHQVGIFKEKYIRGRGAWEDEGRMIIHTGDILIVDREITPLKNFRSRYMYQIGERLGFGTAQPLSKEQATVLKDRAKWLLWEREINAYLLIGWCVIAPFCGVLKWRPHIWVTGPAGSGKSWVMDNIVKKLLGEIAIVVQGKSTEAGIRQLLQSDALPVLFDESDVDNNVDKERIQNILALARSSSYHDGGLIGKGTTSGTSKTYTMRSCFAFSSIGVQLNQQSDRSRFTMLGLRSFENVRTKEDFDKFDREWHELVTDEFVGALQSRTMSLLGVIMRNSRTFADAVANVIGNRRIGDQVGSMLAGAWSLSSDKLITYDKAVEWVQSRDWNEERGLELTKDEYRLFGRIMGSIVRVESEMGQKERSVGELIQISIGEKVEYSITSETAHQRLRRMGIMVRPEERQIWVSNNSDAIQQLIKDTAWSNNYHKILERLPGATKITSRKYAPGIESRGVSIPISMISEEPPPPPKKEQNAYYQAKMGLKDDINFDPPDGDVPF